MKYIVIITAVLVGGIVWSNYFYAEKAPIETVRNIPAEPSLETTPVVIEDTELTPENGAVVIAESQLQTDIGMEYPETDMTIQNTSGARPKVFEISGVNFAFDITKITVQEGDTVTINFTSSDGFHDFVIDAFNARTEKIRTGGATSITFVANKKGTFEYYCSVGSHRVSGMVGTLVVE